MAEAVAQWVRNDIGSIIAGHHKMSDLGVAGEAVHSDGASVEPAWPQTSDGAGLMETTMSKNNDTSNLDHWLVSHQTSLRRAAPAGSRSMPS
jgi:hypothetical protein